MLTESKIIKQITILPQANAVQVQWANQVLKGTDVISETFERKAYSAELQGFNTEVGQLDVNAFLAAFNAASLDEKAEALEARETAEAALATAQAQITTLTTEHAAALASANAQIAAKDAAIAALEDQVAILETPPSPTVINGVPQSVTMRQARLALLGAGLLDDVATAIAALSSPQKEAASIEWEYSQTVERNRGFVLLLGAALGLNDLQLDNLFTQAATL